MGPLAPLALVGGALGFGLWWLLGLLPFWDLSSYLWYFGGTGAFGLVIASFLAEQGKKALWSFLGWGVFMIGIYAMSWGGAWAQSVFGYIPDENMPVYFTVGVTVIMFVGFSAWEGRKGREQERMIAESKERTRQRRERRRQGIPSKDPSGEPESGERP